jgi:hypothetical protein
MIKIEDLGFAKGVICETIVSTYSKHGIPNFAPMGVIKLDQKKIMIKIYKTSNTYKNLLTNCCAVVNLCSDPSMFYMSAIKEVKIENKKFLDLFEKGDLVNAPKLKSADATLEVVVVEFTEENLEKVKIVFEVKSIKGKRCFPKVHCRAFSATIESIILATRIRFYLVGDQLQKKQANKMIEKVMWLKEIVKRTTPKSKQADIMSDLIRRIESWKAKA